MMKHPYLLPYFLRTSSSEVAFCHIFGYLWISIQHLATAAFVYIGCNMEVAKPHYNLISKHIFEVGPNDRQCRGKVLSTSLT